MHVFSTIEEIRENLRQARAAGHTIGCVPTMGALHDGHLSLMKRAKQDGTFLVTTIFVNPTQFGPNEDFKKYPRTLQQDLKICEAAGVDLVFTPTVDEMYPPGNLTAIHVKQITEELEGIFRPGHFDGVATVVMKLFQIIQPDQAYFGKKDFQQLLIIQKMVDDLNMATRIVWCETLREADGLAMSSRNRYLSPEERQRASCIYKALLLGEELLASGMLPTNAAAHMMEQIQQYDESIKIDYVTIADPATMKSISRPQSEMVGLIALRIGTTRLIDNMMYHGD
jgi:pantoate--beta-alanine ligase